ncbi:MAG: aminotransferase class I/II-fold pyridoxal phosphate-dependent enzyme [Polyangiaceae bacterium]
MAFLIPGRTTRPSDDPIFALNTEARARARGGEPVINATVGSLLEDDGSLALLDSVVEVLRETPARVSAAYAPIGGNAEFLQGVIRDLLGDSEPSRWATAVATPGGTGALRHAIANFLSPGDALLTSSFYWGPYKTLAEESDRTLRTFTMFDEKGALHLGAFERELDSVLEKQGRALVFLNSPCHNPTGYSFDAGEWSAVREIVEARASRGPITICLDVAYARFGPQPLDVMVQEMSKLVPKALVLFAWSASKTFLEYGQRVGALVALHSADDERQRITNALSFSCRGTWSNVNAGAMSAFARILLDPALRAKVDAERAKCVELLARRVARWNACAGAAELPYPRYDGGFFTTVFTDGASEIALDLKKDAIFVVPQAGGLRIALASVAEKDVERLVGAIQSRGVRAARKG